MSALPSEREGRLRPGAMEPTEEELWATPAAKRRKLGPGAEQVQAIISVGGFTPLDATTHIGCGACSDGGS